MRSSLTLLAKDPTKFTVLTRSTLHRPPYTARIQTNGSFSICYNPISRTAALLTTIKGDQHSLCKTYFEHANSTETEWCSVLDGIKYSIKKDQDALELENSNLSLIDSLINRKIPKKPYLADYYFMIYKNISQLEYLGIRWIPREQNRADTIFSI